MTCPYPDCPQHLETGAESCSKCRRTVKACPRCQSFNRAFANFCRSCGGPLPEAAGEWRTFKGGNQRLGLNSSAQLGALNDLDAREVLQIRLGDRCRSLIAYDGHLIAVAQNGLVEIADVARPEGRRRLVTGSPITCEPCASDGRLYLGTPGRLMAFSLGTLTLREPRLDPLWEMRLTGTPIQALAVLNDHLYATVVRPDGGQEVQEISPLDSPPPAPRRLHAGGRVSCLAADSASRQLLFLSEEHGQIWIHRIEHDADRPPRPESSKLSGVPSPIAHHVPIAVYNHKIFGIFGERDSLCRVDAVDGIFEQLLRDDVKAFSLTGMRDGVEVSSADITFLGSGVTDRLNPMERVKGSPVILRDCAAIIGLQDGRLRMYDLQTPPRHYTLRIADSQQEVTALISFRRYIAAGDAEGIVKVFELVPRQAG